MSSMHLKILNFTMYSLFSYQVQDLYKFPLKSERCVGGPQRQLLPSLV